MSIFENHTKLVPRLSPKLSFNRWLKKYNDEVEEIFVQIKKKLDNEDIKLLDVDDALEGFKIFMYENSIKR